MDEGEISRVRREEFRRGECCEMFEIGISYFRILFLLVLREVFHLNFTLFNVELNCNCKKRGSICISKVSWNYLLICRMEYDLS